MSYENGFQRKDWIDQRLKELNEICSISVGALAPWTITFTCSCVSIAKKPKAGPIKKSLNVGFVSTHLAVQIANR